MKVIFENVLVCDVVTYTYENKEYPKVVVYEKGNLSEIGIDKSLVSDYKKAIGTFVNLNAELSSYDGKNKFKLA